MGGGNTVARLANGLTFAAGDPTTLSRGPVARFGALRAGGGVDGAELVKGPAERLGLLTTGALAALTPGDALGAEAGD